MDPFPKLTQERKKKKSKKKSWKTGYFCPICSESFLSQYDPLVKLPEPTRPLSHSIQPFTSPLHITYTRAQVAFSLHPLPLSLVYPFHESKNNLQPRSLDKIWHQMRNVTVQCTPTTVHERIYTL